MNAKSCGLFALGLLISGASVAYASPSSIAPYRGPISDSFRSDSFIQGYYFTAGPVAPQVNELGYLVTPGDVFGATPGELGFDHEVGLYALSANIGTLVASTTVPAGSSADSTGYAFVGISTISLVPGAQYGVVAASSGDQWSSSVGSTVTPSFGTYIGGLYQNYSPVLPAALAFNEAGFGYGGPNIGFASTPEPGSLSLLGVGAVYMLNRRRRA